MLEVGIREANKGVLSSFLSSRVSQKKLHGDKVAAGLNRYLRANHDSYGRNAHDNSNSVDGTELDARSFVLSDKGVSVGAVRRLPSSAVNQSRSIGATDGLDPDGRLNPIQHWVRSVVVPLPSLYS